MEISITEGINNLISTILAWTPQVVAAVLVIILGFWVVNIISGIIQRAIKKSNLDPSLTHFFSSLIQAVLKILVVLSAAQVVGIEITAFAALIAGLGLAIGGALNGSLGHLASGVMILIWKPYKVGDLVDIQGQIGHVAEIQIFNTILTSLDNKKIIIPNGVATSGIMTNLSTYNKLRVDLNVAIPYEVDFEHARSIIDNALKKVAKTLSDAPTIEIEKFAENNVLLAVRPYATPEDYWDVYYDSYKEIKKAFAEAKLPVAYPSRILIQSNTPK